MNRAIHIKGKFKTIPNGYCLNCPPDQEPQLVAQFDNGVSLCFAHAAKVQQNALELRDSMSLEHRRGR